MYEQEEDIGSLAISSPLTSSSSSSSTTATPISSNNSLPLYNTLPLARASMKRPHHLATADCSNNTTIMDHFKTVRSMRPRSKTIDNAFSLNHNRTQTTAAATTTVHSDSDGDDIIDELLLSTNSKRSDHKTIVAGSSTQTAPNPYDDAEMKSADKRIDDNNNNNNSTKFSTLLAAFSNAKRSSSTKSLSTLQQSIARPLSRQQPQRPEVSLFNNSNKQQQQTQLALVAKSSISFPATLHQPGPSNHHCGSTLNSGYSLASLPEIDEEILRYTAGSGGASGLTSIANHIPTDAEKEQFQRSLDNATALVFHRRNGIPLTSSPAPIRKCGTSFDFDSSLTSVNAIKKALFEKDSGSRHFIRSRQRSRLSFSSSPTSTALLGNFEESVLNGRLEPASIVNGFTAEIGASGSFVPPHRTLPVTVFFYTLFDTDKGDKQMSGSPYLGHIALGPKGYHVPRTGTVQVTLFNPNGTVVKMFVVRYDLSDMPPNSRTFLRQRTLFMPSDATEHHPDSRKWLRYLIHLRFQSSKSGRIRLHTDLRILVFQKHDLDVATLNGGGQMELRSFVQMPSNPKYSKNLKQS